MTPTREDRLLDVFLEELLAGKSPPDLSARILQAWRQETAERNGHAEPEPPPVWLPPAVMSVTAVSPANAVSPVNAASRGHAVSPAPTTSAAGFGASARRGDRSRWWVGTLAIYLACVLGGLAGFWAVNVLNQPAARVAERAVDAPTLAEGRGRPTPNGQQPDHKQAVASQPSRVRPLPPIKSAPIHSGRQHAAQPHGGQPIANHPAAGDPLAANQGANGTDAADAKAPAAFARRAATTPPLADQEVVRFIDSTLRQAWKDAKITPAGPAADEEWCRRAYLRLVGRIPSVGELREWLRDSDPDKRAKLVDKLLASSEYSEHWAELLTNVLVGRAVETSGVARREDLKAYLEQSLAEGKSYDRLAHELLTASGSNRPEASDHNGAVNFLLDGWRDDGVLAANRSSRVFLGHQLQCAQCHNHHANEWSQQDFWSVNAFFRQTRAEVDGKGADGKGTARLVDGDYAPSGEKTADEAEVYFEMLNGKLKVAYPAVLGHEIARSGRLRDVNRRVEFANIVVAAPEFSRAAVNRLWSHFLGQGFANPVDDLGPHNPPAHPALLDRLGEQFAAHDFDLRALSRWIALSEPFGLSSQAPTTGVGAHGLARVEGSGEGPPMFARYPLRAMEPEEVYKSLVVASEAFKGRRPGDLAMTAWVNQFSRRLENDEATAEHVGPINRSLIIMNDPLMRAATSKEDGSFLRRIAQANISNEAKVEHLFEAALARKPRKKELEVASTLFEANARDPATALEAIWWALLNSNEFVLDH